METKGRVKSIREPMEGRTLLAGSKSVRAMGRRQNDDASLAEPAAGVFVIADSVGTHAAGAEASEFLCAVVSGELMEQGSDSTVCEDAMNHIRFAVLTALRGMKRIAERCHELRDMGATVVIGWFLGDFCYFAHAGDSRLYLWRDGQLRQLTNDHSLAAKRMHTNKSSSDSKCLNPMPHCLTRYIGPTSKDVRLDVNKIQSQAGDRYIFLTYGITSGLNNDAISQAAQFASTPHELCDWLVRAATSAAGTDDMSCIVVDCGTSTRQGAQHCV